MTFALPEMDPCYFCEIIRGGVERWNVIDETELTVTLLNGRQFEVGQCIVIPVRHAPTLLDLNDGEEAAVMAAAKRAARAMMRALTPPPSGILLYQNNGVGSGQEVPHFHMHVVPRRRDSDWGLGPPHIVRLEQSRPPAHLDHVAITDAKRQTVEQLRQAHISER